MSEATLQVELRQRTGHQTAKSLRQKGRIPAIYYANDEESVPVSVDTKILELLMHQMVNIFDVVFPDGNTKKSILREVQRDPVTEALVHVDIMGVKLTQKVKLTIPILLRGTPAGVKEGGILEHLLREVEIEGLPLDIPDHIEIDVTELDIGDSINLEVVNIDKIRLVTDPHHAVAHVIHPKVIQVAEEEVEEEAEVLEGEEVEEKEGEAPKSEEPPSS